MAATVSGPRYAPEDPTLPKPWKGLVDGKTGYLYFWNPETNVTQYERPVASSLKGSAPSHKPPTSISSSVQVQQSSTNQCRENGSFDGDGDRYNRVSNGGMKLVSETKSYQSAKDGSDHSHISNGAVGTGNGGPSRGHGSSSAGSGLSVEAYCRRHEITVTGGNIPPPFLSFEDTGLPSEILREVYLSAVFMQLQGAIFAPGRSQMSYAVLPSFRGLAYIWSALVGGPIFEKLSESPKVMAETGVGDDSVCHLVRRKKRPTPAVACISKLGLSSYKAMMLLLALAACIIPKRNEILKGIPLLTEVAGYLLFQVRQAGFSAPTPIQAQSWPVALQSRDIVAIAKTGSGKTLGYLIPGFVHLKRSRKNPQMGPTVLVLSPTRELATQIQDEAVKFGKSSKIACTCLYGGAPKGPQLRDLERGADIVVATPGRLNDILEMRRISLSQVSYLVLDEADRMLDMGFEPQIRKIVNEVPARRQTLMYTATWPKEVRKIAADLLVNPVQVNIGNVDELVANKSITQHVELLSSMEKHRRVEQIIRSQEPGSKIIIFCSTKKMCDQLARNLTRPFGAAAIHGDKSQGERDYVLNQFRSGKSPVLVATDVAARGLDIKDIRVVVNYDFPTGIEDYVHRIGRTGRAGATGEAYTFFGDQDAKHASDLVKVLEGANQRVPAEIRDLASRGGGMGGRSRRWGSGPDSGSGFSFGGRDGGRGGRFDSGYGGRNGGGHDRYGRDADAPGSYQFKSFHETMVSAGERRGRSRSRSPNKGSGWSDNRNRDRSRSRSPNRFDRAPPARERSPVRSFHKAMMERTRSPPLSRNLQYNNGTNGRDDPHSHPHERSRSPPVGPKSRSYPVDEDEEGLIRAEQ